VPARAVAHLLLDSHQQERQRGQRGRRSTSTIASGGVTPTSPGPKELGVVSSGRGAGIQSSHRRSLFESYERVTCTYIGSCEVGGSQGMEIINLAVETLTRSTDNWQEVGVDVTTSSITICDIKVGVATHKLA